MHYGGFAFSRNGRRTIETLRSGVLIGQRTGLSAGDVATVRAMYPSGDPEITSPASDAKLTDSTVIFVWNGNGQPVDRWWLFIGSKAGRRDYFNSGSLGTRLSTVVTGLPADESQLHVRLWFRIGATWEFEDFSYTAAIRRNPTIIAPVPGSVLPGSNATFEWTADGAAVTQWWLYVGSRLGGPDIFNSGSLGTNVSVPVSGLPTDSRQVHVRLYYRINGNWQSSDFQYTAATASASQITSPAPNSVLTGSTVTFQWSANVSAVKWWWMYIGDEPGTDNWYNQGWQGSHLSTTVNGLPTDGRPIHVRFLFLIGENWQTTDYLYTAAN